MIRDGRSVVRIAVGNDNQCVYRDARDDKGPKKRGETHDLGRSTRLTPVMSTKTVMDREHAEFPVANADRDLRPHEKDRYARIRDREGKKAGNIRTS